MDPARFARIEALFEAALAEPVAQRDAFLRQACGDDDELRAAVQRLLEHDAADGTLSLASPPRAFGAGFEPDRHMAPGRRIGPYKVLDLLGEGGFGSVYLAEQTEPVNRRVALKIVKSGMDSAQVIARFEAERQALAMMDHANIARVLDAGTTDAASGARPYFVMELVRGHPITTYCDEGRLSVRARIEFFLDVCAAIQHAHQKGVIHRDIKPSNVLVASADEGATVKVIDFGIAKALYQRLTERTLHTALHQFVGTPEYMSPEQASGVLDVDTRSDIYSLGVLLYELLVGSTPFDATTFASRDPGLIRERVRETVVMRPSSKVRTDARAGDLASARSVDARALSESIRGDLDWIVMKALDKDRARRYQGASELANDLRRHLRNEPVTAGPPSPLYVLGKFVRRHRPSVIAAGLALATVLVAFAGTTWGMLQARSAAREAQAMNTFLRDVLTSVDPAADGPDVPLRTVMVRAAQSVPERFADYPDRAAEVGTLLGEVFAQLGQDREAVPLLLAGLEHVREEEGPTASRSIALARAAIGANIGVHALDAAESLADRLVAETEAAFGPEDAASLSARVARAELRIERGDYDGAETEVRDVIARSVRRFGDRHETTREARNMLSAALWRRINGIEAVGEETVRELHDVLEQIMAIEPRASARGITARRRSAWVALNALDYERCEQMAREVVELGTEYYGADHPTTTGGAHLLSIALHRLGRYDEAAEWTLRGLEAHIARLGLANPMTLSMLMDGLPALVMSKSLEAAEGHMEDGLEVVRRFEPDGGPMSTELSTCLAPARVRGGKLDEAEAPLAAARAGLDFQPQFEARIALTAGELAAARGDDVTAEVELHRALELSKANSLRRFHVEDEAVAALVDLYERTGRAADAAALRAGADG